MCTSKLRFFSQALIFSIVAAISPILADDFSEEECSKEILLAYFPETFVQQTLKKFQIPEKEWAAINKELQEKDKTIISIIEDKASKMNPNPLKDPQQRQIAVNLFRDTLFEVFADVLKKHGITDSGQLHSMLEDVQQQKAKRFAQCLEKRTPVNKN